MEPPKGKTYRNILVVDDSVSSGKTMNNVLKFVRDQFPKADVRAAVLYAPEKSSGVCHVDYVVARGRVPLIWPWGVEAD